MKTVRYFKFDARSAFIHILKLLHASLWTLNLLIVVMTLFWVLERKGLSFPAALRALRVWLIGPHRPGWIFSRRRKLHDSGS